jgi:putative transcriptional regulator
MSMTRNEAIQHFGLRSRSKKTAAEHLAAAPASVRAGLHQQDLEWIERHPDVPAVEAAARLAARSRANPDGIVHGQAVAEASTAIESPAPAAVRDYRVRAGLTQTQAGALCHRSLRAWQDAEAGLRALDPAAWELFLLRTGQHPTETLKTRQRAA